eukprot:m.332184 g.332184  ORF g.332184 m.332184 type:complete len:62 (-) comp55631_c0_seq11:1469-1654(-)
MVLTGLFLALAIVLHAVEAGNHPRAGTQRGEQFMLFCLCMGRLGNQVHLALCIGPCCFPTA